MSIESAGLTFLDINTFFARKAGGIRRYHEAKIAYFGAQSVRRYLLVYPGPKRALRILGPTVSLLEAYGPLISKEAGGYRFLLDYVAVLRFIRRHKPAVIESGDPWLTGTFCLLIKALGLHDGLLVSFVHSDPVQTHVEPRADRGRARVLRRLLARFIAWVFYGLQARYDLTVVSSLVMEQHFLARGIKATRVPFGVPSGFFDDPGPRKPRDGAGARLLYMGRLNREKGIELIAGSLDVLLAIDNTSVTTAGRGEYSEHFAAVDRPRFRHLGYVEDQATVRALYDSHDILLSPGPVESFGIAIIEAMARGMVVVGPDEGGAGELLRRSGSPFIFRAGDREDFLRVVRLAINCDWQAVGERARQFALSHGTLEQAMGRLTDLYESCRAPESRT